MNGLIQLGTVQGHLARPEGPGPFPAMIVIHEWWGWMHKPGLLQTVLQRKVIWLSRPTFFTANLRSLATATPP